MTSSIRRFGSRSNSSRIFVIDPTHSAENLDAVVRARLTHAHEPRLRRSAQITRVEEECGDTEVAMPDEPLEERRGPVDREKLTRPDEERDPSFRVETFELFQQSGLEWSRLGHRLRDPDQVDLRLL